MRAKHNPVGAAQQSCDGLDAEFWHNVEHLVSLGAIPVGEIYIELAARFGIRTEIESLVRRYRRLDPALGGRWWQ